MNAGIASLGLEQVGGCISTGESASEDHQKARPIAIQAFTGDTCSS